MFKEFKKLCKSKNNKFKKKSFSLLTEIIHKQSELGSDNFDSNTAIKEVKKTISKWSDAQFAYLLIHSCYIPDYYPETGSKETLFSKLVEYLIYEWGQRLGYHTELQKQKSTKEDITFFKENDVIVCDAKSYRLGRSQRSPNVKDVIKTSEYQTWLKFYSDKNQIGGFVTFPSLMEWLQGSTIHTYLTDKNNPIMLIYNEYLSFMLLKKSKNKNLLFEILNNYSSLFPKRITNKNKAKKKYEKIILDQLKKLEDENELNEFSELAKQITNEYVDYSIEKLRQIIKKNVHDAKQEEAQTSNKKLRIEYVKLKARLLNKEHKRMLCNIEKFRRQGC